MHLRLLIIQFLSISILIAGPDDISPWYYNVLPGGSHFYRGDFKDAILFIEGQDVNIRRILWELETLRLLGVFNMIKGVVIGHFVNFEEERCRKKYKINVEIEDLFLEVLKDYNFPILKVHEFGHFCSNTILPIGATIRMDAEKKELEIIEDFLI